MLSPSFVILNAYSVFSAVRLLLQSSTRKKQVSFIANQAVVASLTFGDIFTWPRDANIARRINCVKEYWHYSSKQPYLSRIFDTITPDSHICQGILTLFCKTSISVKEYWHNYSKQMSLSRIFDTIWAAVPHSTSGKRKTALRGLIPGTPEFCRFC